MNFKIEQVFQNNNIYKTYGEYTSQDGALRQYAEVIKNLNQKNYHTMPSANLPNNKSRLAMNLFIDGRLHSTLVLKES